jgi:hypothetical protein
VVEGLKQRCIIAMVYGSWGRGQTMDEALAQLKRASGQRADELRRQAKFWLIIGDDKAFVDDMGCICYHGESFRLGGMMLDKPKSKKKAS